MLRTMKYIVILNIIISINFINAQSDEEDFASLNYSGTIFNRGSSAAAFLEIGVGSRAMGLGGAYTSIESDATCMYWNPAGIGWINELEILAHHSNWLANTNFQYFGLISPMNETTSIGLSITLLDYIEKQPVRTILQPEGTGEVYGASDLAIGFTYSRVMTNRFAFGISGKYIRQKIWNEVAATYAMDVGIHYKTYIQGLSLGSSISNFGNELKLEGRDLIRAYDEDQLNYSNDKLNVQHSTDSFPLPLIIRSGLSYKRNIFYSSSLLMMVDLIHPSNDVESMNVGLEFNTLNIFSIRLGYQSIFNQSSQSGLTSGFGVELNKNGNLPLSIHYSYANWGILHDVHTFTIDWSFVN